jgi:FMN phosphatase YigB (HAD superfamily)
MSLAHIVFHWTLGKQSHIESAAKYFYKASKIKIKPQEVLLFDDDDQNIRVAKKYSMRTVKVVDNTTLPSLLSRDNF